MSDRPHDSTRERTVIAAHRLYHQAVLCDATHSWQMARVMWAKYAEAARRLERGTSLMKNTGQRLW
jgi:uncharacterized protein YqiB (DUF1249 family)